MNTRRGFSLNRKTSVLQTDDTGALPVSSIITFDENGRRRKGFYAQCGNCCNFFLKRKNTKAKFCSQDCSQKARVDRIKVCCNHCDTTIEKVRCRVSSSSNGKFFCDRKCKESYTTRMGKNFDGLKSYKAKAFGELPNCCSDCGETARFLLVVHHIDGDRTNNNIDNLTILCHNHHARRHLKLKDGEWILDYTQLTPLHELDTT